MKVPRPKLLVAAAAVGAVLVVGLIAAGADNVDLALICVLLVQSAALVAIVDTRRRQGGLSDTISKNTAALKRIDRDLANVSARVVTEARATEKEMAARIRRFRIHFRDLIANSADRADRRADFRLQDVEAMFQLFATFQPRAALPPSGRWALESSGLLRLVDLIERRPIQTIVELGSGTSTLWLSYALEKRGTGGRIIALDHDAHYAQLTRRALATHGFADGPAEVRDAPLTHSGLDDHVTPWYDARTFQDLEGIDLLVVDGPPKSAGGAARYPALPMLLSRLAPGALIVIDDAARPDETAMIERWLDDVPGLRRLDESGPGRQVVLELGA